MSHYNEQNPMMETIRDAGGVVGLSILQFINPTAEEYELGAITAAIAARILPELGDDTTLADVPGNLVRAIGDGARVAAQAVVDALPADYQFGDGTRAVIAGTQDLAAKVLPADYQFGNGTRAVIAFFENYLFPTTEVAAADWVVVGAAAEEVVVAPADILEGPAHTQIAGGIYPSLEGLENE